MIIQNKRIKVLFDEIYQQHLEIPNISYFIKGEYQAVIGFPDKSFEALIKNKTIRDKLIQKIEEIRTTEKHSNYDELALSVAEYFVENMMFPLRCSMEDFYYLEFGITPYEFPIDYFWGSLHLYDCSTRENVVKHMVLTKDYIRFTDQMHKKVLEQVDRDIFLFKDMIASTCDMLRSFASVEYDQHPLCMQREGSQATDEEIKIERQYIRTANQNLFNLIALLESPAYQEKAPSKPGWGQFEKGLAYYKNLRYFHLGYEVDTLELHNLGKQLLKEAKDKQAAIRARLGFEGTHEAFVNSLRGNERFFPTTPESLEKLMTGILEKIQSSMNDYFSEKVKTPYEIKRIDPKLEASLTFGYFQPSFDVNEPGIYFFNGAQLDKKHQLAMPALLAHEIIPGHHYQQSYLYENDDLHPIFKMFFAPAYLEGWAEYSAAFLGEEGIFDDYDKYGCLENDKFACVRLIVDTGLNELGWSLEKARSYMLENTFVNEQMAISETNRYTYCIPAQCLSYKFGALKMINLRDRVSSAIDGDFDYIKFHSLVLNAGCVPLPILESYILKEYGLEA